MKTSRVPVFRYLSVSALSLICAGMFSACNQEKTISPAPVVQKTPNPVVKTDFMLKAAQERLNAPEKELTAMAQLGRKIFFDASLSASGKMSCATCHDPGNAYAPGNDLAVQLGGSKLQMQGGRAVPSLRYHEYTPVFSIGPDIKPDLDDKDAVKKADELKSGAISQPILAKATLDQATAVQEVVPQGGFDWDGRAQNFSDQAGGPLMAVNEMANTSEVTLLEKLKKSPYAQDMIALFGPGVFSSPKIALGEVYFALARFQLEDRSFHPYNSKYDYYLAQKAQLNEQELRGLNLFKDPKKGNCATCHLEKSSKDSRFPPMFTDYQFEALAAPRNMAIAANKNPAYYDLGMCGPLRKDYVKQEKYCGFFKTPSLRNVATRKVFFHNGVFHSLEDVLHFYVERETHPEKWYPVAANGKVKKYNDIPAHLHANVDVTDAPFDRKSGDPAVLTDQEIQDVIAFLHTLNDGYLSDQKTTK